MRVHPNQLRWLAAGVILASGAYASTTLQKPATQAAPDVHQIQEMAVRAKAPIVDARPLLPIRVAMARPVAPPKVEKPAAVKPQPAKEPEKPAAPPTSTVSALANLALVGVTTEGSQVQAWLVDVNTQDSKTVAKGDTIDGYTVRDILPERVVFAKGDDQVTIRMGEKYVPPPAQDLSASASTGQNDPNGWGNRRGGWGARGGWGGRGGGGGRQAPSGGGSGNRWSGGGGGRPQFSGNFNRNFNGNFNGQNQQQNTYTRTSTSNPQEARRRGARLVAGISKRIQDPDPIFNPQTVRRLGSADGRAFGADDSRHTRQQNRASASNAYRYIK